MLLAIDIGNSNISVGLFGEGRDLKFLASIDTDSRKTADQISIDLMNLFALYGYDIRQVTGAIFSSVVPGNQLYDAQGADPSAGQRAHGGGTGIKTGLNIQYGGAQSTGHRSGGPMPWRHWKSIPPPSL